MRRNRGSKRGLKRKKVKNENFGNSSHEKDGRRRKKNRGQKKFRNDYNGYEINETNETSIPVLNEPIDPERFFKEFVAKRRYVAINIVCSHQCAHDQHNTDLVSFDVSRNR